MRIGILTHPLATNYGGLLQAYALQQILIRDGHDVITINCNNRVLYTSFIRQFLGWLSRLKKRYINKKNISPCFSPQPTIEQNIILSRNTDLFINNINTTYCFYDYKELLKIDKEYNFEAYVVGSDQVWLPSFFPWSFLNFVTRDNVKRIAYAASFGHATWQYDDEQTKKASQLAKKFDAISVREDSSVTLCKDYLKVKALHVLDPTMLLNPKDYLSVINVKKVSKMIFAYVLDKSVLKQKIVKTIADKLQLNVYTCMPEEEFINGVTKDISKCIFPAVDDWINGINNAEFVVTDSFHGTVFAILFNKPFVVTGNEHRGMARFESLLRMFGLEDRLTTSLEKALELVNTPIDYVKVNQIIEEKRRESLQFLSILKK